MVKPVFWLTGAQDNDPVLAAAAAGLQRAGVPNEIRALAAYDPAPPGIFYGLLGLGEHRPEGEWWVLDRGFFGAQRNGVGGYYRLARRDLQPHFRPNSNDVEVGRLKRLGLGPEPWQHNPKGITLICPPPLRTTRFYGTTPEAWFAKTLDQLPRSLQDRVVVREKGNPTSLAAHLAAARCVVVFNSNVAVDALLAGKPAYATHGIVHSWFPDGVKYADSGPGGYPHSRLALLHFAAASQGTLAEFRNGKVWRRALRLQGNGFTQEALA